MIRLFIRATWSGFAVALLAGGCAAGPPEQHFDPPKQEVAIDNQWVFKDPNDLQNYWTMLTGGAAEDARSFALEMTRVGQAMPLNYGSHLALKTWRPMSGISQCEVVLDSVDSWTGWTSCGAFKERKRR